MQPWPMHRNGSSGTVAGSREKGRFFGLARGRPQQLSPLVRTIPSSRIELGVPCHPTTQEWFLSTHRVARSMRTSVREFDQILVAAPARSRVRNLSGQIPALPETPGPPRPLHELEWRSDIL